MRWLHLSDIHVGRPDQTRANAMRLLLQAIEDNACGESIDLVIFTGDLAFSGETAEYSAFSDELMEPLKRLDVTKKAHFIAVPGNHDLDCDCSHPIDWGSLGEARQQKFWDSDTKGIDLRSARANGFKAFAEFVNSADILAPDPTKQVGARFDLDVSDQSVSVICLNTALFSDKLLSDEQEREMSPLPVQVVRSLAYAKPLHKPTLILGHHPTKWFDRTSRENFLSVLKEFGAVYLHGHTHEIESHFRSHALATLGFGAAYPAHIESQAAPYTSTFAICQLEEELHLRFVSWDPTHGKWHASIHIPGEISEPSDVLEQGFRVPVPTTKSATLLRSNAANPAHTPLQLNSPIWLDADYIEQWPKLLATIGVVEGQDDIIQHGAVQALGGQVAFILSDKNGRHCVRAFAAETTVITYEHVENANTELDTLQLDSYIICTFGKISEAAEELAANLSRKKNIKVFDGELLARRIAETPSINDRLLSTSAKPFSFKARPLITHDGIAFLLLSTPANDRYAIVDQKGDVLSEHDPLVITTREKLPELQSITYGLELPEIPTAISSREAFDRSAYLQRSLSIYDTAKYAGLAAIGIRLPVESLRQIYVPTAANVESDQDAIEATSRAIEDIVEALGLDEVQKMQLARQMKSTYGVRSTSEVDAASGLYKSLSNVVILGDPGSGKSCFVRAQVMSYCDPPDGPDSDWYGQHIPIVLPLAQYADVITDGKSLLEHCVDHAQSQQLKLDLVQLRVLLSRGLVALFLDGLDEIGSAAARQQVVAQVDELLREHAPKGNRFVLTSRPAAVRDLDLPSGLTNLSLQGLTDDEIGTLATRLFQSRYSSDSPLPDSDQKIVDSILRDCKAKPGIRRLARNPLLLTLVVLIYENSGSFAAKRHLIYSQAVKTLVSVRHRDIFRARIAEADLRTRLGLLAVAIFQRDVGPLPSRAEVASLLDRQLPQTQTAPQEFVQNVAEMTGLLMLHPRGAEKEGDLVSFMHHSFLEYYTALGLIEQEQYIEQAFFLALTPRWSEIVTLMFGILGEHTDVTERLSQLGEHREDADSITAGRTLIAFDCALECDVPPEAAQQYLAQKVHTLMSDGSGLYVSDVREELATRIRLLLESAESQLLKDTLLRGVADSNPDVAAAYIHLVSKLGSYSNGNSEFVEAISEQFYRDEESVRLTVINAMRELSALRTKQNLRILRRTLERGGIVARTAALQLLEEEPTLIDSFQDQVTDLMLRDGSLSFTAASCVLRGGVYEIEGTIDRNLLDHALRILTTHEGPRQSLFGKLTIAEDELDSLIYSENAQDRSRGFRALVAVEDDTVTVHKVLFECLRTETNGSVIETILNALSAYPTAIKVASLADTDLVCHFCKDNRQNVRAAAARALRLFAPLQTVTDSLKQRFDELNGVDSKEADEVTRSLATHAVKDESCRRDLMNQLTRFLNRDQIRWSQRSIQVFLRLLAACDQAGIQLSSRHARIVIQLATDYKTPNVVRPHAMRFYGQTCPTTPTDCMSIVKEFRVADADRRLAAYRAASRFLARSKVRVETVQALRESLLEMRNELVQVWPRESRAAAQKYDSPALREIRSCLVTIESTLASYDEFADRVSADRFTGDT